MAWPTQRSAATRTRIFLIPFSSHSPGIVGNLCCSPYRSCDHIRSQDEVEFSRIRNIDLKRTNGSTKQQIAAPEDHRGSVHDFVPTSNRSSSFSFQRLGTPDAAHQDKGNCHSRQENNSKRPSSQTA